VIGVPLGTVIGSAGVVGIGRADEVEGQHCV